MSAYKKNLLIGIMSLVALLLLGWMILQFGDAPLRLLAKKQIPIHLHATQVDGLSEGSPINFRGVSVGRVTKIALSDDQTSVLINAVVELRDPPLPGNLQGFIRMPSWIGSSAIIDLEFLPATQPSTPAPKYLEPNAELECTFVGREMVPKEISAGFAAVTKTINDLNDMKFVANLNQTVTSVRTQVDKLGPVIDSVQKVVGNDKLRGDVEAALANFRAVSENAKTIAADLERLTKSAQGNMDTLAQNSNKVIESTGKLVENANNVVVRTGGHVDDLAKQLGDRIQQVAVLLDSMDKFTQKLNGGTGTAAQLLNDGKLYESLLDTSRELNLTILDLKRLVQQWEQEGVSIKLNK